MIQIRKEVEEVLTGQQPKDNNVLKNAPHPIDVLTVTEQEWNKCVDLFTYSLGTKMSRRPYSREKAAYPLAWLKQRKFWPTVSRIDDAYGDLNLHCECPTVEELAEHAV
jgi:glycine dehydrogenase